MADAERPIAQSPKSRREMSARDVDFDSKFVAICNQRFTFARFRNLFLMRFYSFHIPEE